MSSPSGSSRYQTITLGTSALGTADDALESARALLFADDLLIDTSNGYAGGRSERVLGEALAELDPVARAAAEARIITKVDRDPETGRFDDERVLRSFEESLERLGIDRVRLLHLHDPYTVTFAEAMSEGGAVEALVRLKDEGLVDRIGIAAGPVPLLRRYVDTGVFDAVLCHNRFTFVDRSAAGLFAAAKQRDMTVFNAAPFGGGLLARGPQPGANYAYRPASEELRAWTADLEALCADAGISLPAAALQFSTRSPLIDRTIVGVSSQKRLDDLCALCAEEIPAELWAAIDALDPAPSPIDDTE